ncbi:acyl-CoA dehydrogenase family protein, partial [Symbiobacterium thermophilum]
MSETASNVVKGGSFLLSQASPDQVFTPEDLSEEQRMIGSTAREFSEKVFARLHEIEQDKPFHSRPLLRELGELGLLGLEIPEEYGGMGLDKVTATVATEE